MNHRFCIYFFVSLFFLWSAVSSASDEELARFSSPIAEAWQNQITTLDDPLANTGQRVTAKNTLLTLLKEKGMDSSPLLSAAYSVKGQELLAVGRYESAVWSFRAALDMDPGFIPAARGLLIASFRMGIPAFVRSIPQFAQTYLHALSDHWTLLLLIGDLSAVFILVFPACLLVILITVIMKYSSLWIHEFKERIPYGLPPYVPLVITALVLALPILIGLGLIWSMFWWIILFYLFLHKGELRILWIFLLLTFLVIPLNFIRITIFKAYHDPYFQSLLYLKQGGYCESAVNRLKLYPNSDNDSLLSIRRHFISGLQYKRGGLYDAAVAEYLEYTRLEPMDDSGHVNLGNLYYLLNRMDDAIREYLMAAQANPENAIIYLNLSKAYLQQFQFQKATDMLDRATQIDPERVTQETDNYNATLQPSMIDCSIPNSWIYQDLKRIADSLLRIHEKYWIRLGPGLSTMGAVIVMSTIVGFLLLIHCLRGYGKLSKFCIMCGEPTCPKCQKVEAPDKYCPYCGLLFIKKGNISIKEREQMLREIERRNRRTWIKGLYLSFIFPGSSELFHGRYFRGSSIVFFWSFLICILLSEGSRFSFPWNVPSIGWLFGPFVLFLLLGFLYVLSLFLAYKGSEF